jgi:hypothetical protein
VKGKNLSSATVIETVPVSKKLSQNLKKIHNAQNNSDTYCYTPLSETLDLT